MKVLVSIKYSCLITEIAGFSGVQLTQLDVNKIEKLILDGSEPGPLGDNKDYYHESI
jgi:hypothetical protein